MLHRGCKGVQSEEASLARQTPRKRTPLHHSIGEAKHGRFTRRSYSTIHHRRAGPADADTSGIDERADNS